MAERISGSLWTGVAQVRGMKAGLLSLHDDRQKFQQRKSVTFVLTNQMPACNGLTASLPNIKICQYAKQTAPKNKYYIT